MATYGTNSLIFGNMEDGTTLAKYEQTKFKESQDE
jgi:hypothetical protein